MGGAKGKITWPTKERNKTHKTSGLLFRNGKCKEGVEIGMVKYDGRTER